MIGSDARIEGAALPIVRLETWIDAPKERCFDLARNVEAHAASTADSAERAVGGVTSGLLELGDEVTWEARHFGVRQRLTAKMVRVERPHLFVDVMVRGAFASFTHLHEFVDERGGTLMRDVFEYRSPLGMLGVLADWMFLERHMTRFLRRRAEYLKRAAETRD